MEIQDEARRRLGWSIVGSRVSLEFGHRRCGLDAEECGVGLRAVEPVGTAVYRRDAVESAPWRVVISGSGQVKDTQEGDFRPRIR